MRLLSTVASISLLTLSLASYAAPITFDILDHPDGAVNDQFGNYGLRVDVNSPNGPAARTFSVEDGPADVRLTIDDSTNRAFMVGTIHNDGSGNLGDLPVATFQIIQVFDQVSINASTAEFTASAGMLYLLDSSTFANIADISSLVNAQYDDLVAGSVDFGLAEAFRYQSQRNNEGSAFVFRADGHRLAGDSSSFVGRGWLNAGGTNDWLVRARQVQVSEPASWLLMIAGLTFVARRRTRT